MKERLRSGYIGARVWEAVGCPALGTAVSRGSNDIISPSLCAAFSLCKLYALSVSIGRSSVAQPLSGHNLPAWHQQKPSFPFPVVLAEVSGLDLTEPTGSCALFAPVAAGRIPLTGQAWEGRV